MVYVKIESIAPDGTLRASLQQDSGAQASMMAVDNSTGEVLAMVGAQGLRAIAVQPRHAVAADRWGSSFKPYVYTTAIEGGAKPYRHHRRRSHDLPHAERGPYTPHNYEKDYKGAMTLLNAVRRVTQYPRVEAGGSLRHSQGDRDRASLRHYKQHPGVSARGHRLRGHHAGRAGRSLQRLSERWNSASSLVTFAR